MTNAYIPNELYVFIGTFLPFEKISNYTCAIYPICKDISKRLKPHFCITYDSVPAIQKFQLFVNKQSDKETLMNKNYTFSCVMTDRYFAGKPYGRDSLTLRDLNLLTQCIMTHPYKINDESQNDNIGEIFTNSGQDIKTFPVELTCCYNFWNFIESESMSKQFLKMTKIYAQKFLKQSPRVKAYRNPDAHMKFFLKLMVNQFRRLAISDPMKVIWFFENVYFSTEISNSGIILAKALISAIEKYGISLERYSSIIERVKICQKRRQGFGKKFTTNFLNTIYLYGPSLIKYKNSELLNQPIKTE